MLAQEQHISGCLPRNVRISVSGIISHFIIITKQKEEESSRKLR
jgi:hypothetical protein